MRDRIINRLSYANVVATLALFIALGGSSYAVTQINGSQITDKSISEKKLKRNTLGGTRIDEARLGVVPRARNSARVGGLSAQQLLLRCPSGTFPAADVCVETQARAPLTYTGALLACGETEATRTPGRRLPTHGELRRAFTFDQVGPIAAGGELTGEVYPSSTRPGEIDVLYMGDELGTVGVVPNRDDGAKAFRCVVDPGN